MRSLLFLLVTSLFVMGCSTKSGPVSQVQIQKKKQYVLHQRRFVSPPLIIVDGGHGGTDTGAKSMYVVEKDLCLKTSLHVQRFLSLMGYKVIMSRSTDKFIPLKERSSLANHLRADLFVSIHFNASHNKSAKGLEIYIPKHAHKERKHRSKEAAKVLLHKMIAYTKAPSRGVKEANFAVIRESQMPSILIEGGFITNDEEKRDLLNDQYIELLSLAIAEGIDQYFQTL